MTGTVEAVDFKGEVMDFLPEGGTLRKDVPFVPEVFGQEKPELDYSQGSPHPFDYSSALTCHKAQGGEWDRVMVFDGWVGSDRDFHRRWAYTAASRARQALRWVA
jgi:exodeoxyribonuclease-5